MYSDLYLKPQFSQRVPSIFIVALVALFAVLVGQIFVWYADAPIQASPVTLVRQANVNVSDVSAGIFFETSDPARAYVIYGESSDNLRFSAYSEESTADSGPNRTFHWIEIKDLSPERDYYYQIIANDQVVFFDQKDLYSFRTQNPAQAQRANMLPVYGKVASPNGDGLPEAFILVSFESEFLTGTYLSKTKSSGEWLATIPGNVSQDITIVIDVFHEEYGPSRVRASLQNAAPIPQTILMGQDYVFLSNPQDVLPASTVRTRPSQGHSISVLYPEKNATVPHGRPLFKGFGVPFSRVTIEVNSRPAFQESVIVSDKGSWIVEPAQAFAPGNYVLRVNLSDNNGQLRTINRSFTIAKAGEQVLGESAPSTPSATLSPSIVTTPTSAPLLSPTLSSPSTTPTIVYVTATPGYMTTQTITPSALLDAGSETPLSWIFMGSILISSGVFLLRANWARDE